VVYLFLLTYRNILKYSFHIRIVLNNKWTFSRLTDFTFDYKGQAARVGKIFSE